MDEREPDDHATYPDIISAYSRAQALDDGVLVDATQPARETGFRHPVALTRAVWDRCVAISPAAERAGCDPRGRLHDLLWVLFCTIRRGHGGPELAFDVLCVVDSVRPLRVPLRAVVGPGDQGEPVITVMLPGES
jgi:hypothetical protein